MKTVRIALDKDLLKAADGMATRLHVSRSVLIREALRYYLRHARVTDRETADRAGYARFRESAAELAVWDGVASWPEDSPAQRVHHPRGR